MTLLGEVVTGETFYVSVKADTIKVSEGQEVNLSLTDFNIVERPFTTPDGVEMVLKWLSPKRG